MKLGSGRYLGEIEVELTAQSPLLLRGAVRERAVRDDGVHAFPTRAFPGATGEPEPYLPGSALAGVLRSLHEVIAGGCLRVFHGDFRPGHRDVAKVRGTGWTLGLVEAVDAGGRPVRLRLCDEVVWVPAHDLARALGGPDKVVTGARVDLPGNGWVKHGHKNRNELISGAEVTAGTGWTVLVTDLGTRQRSKGVFFAVGRLSETVAEEVADKAWEDYQWAVDGTNDMRLARRPNTVVPTGLATLEEEVRRGPELLGKRHLARRALLPGQVLWVLSRGQGRNKLIDDFALSAIWRHAGKHAAKERVPTVLLPCSDPDDLCPTCRIFGSADTEREDRPEARQRSYRGHVRFSDARVAGPYSVKVEHLAPLGQPRPGAGQFYLEPNDVNPGERPLRDWGSNADKPVRMLRGRKHYWLTAQADKRPLLRVKDRPFTGEMAKSAETVEAGARFVFTVRFENLTAAQLGGLLAVLEPGPLPCACAICGGKGGKRKSERYGFAVGGGRPFGFGTCTSSIRALRVDTAESRYLAEFDPPDPAEVTAAARTAFEEDVDPGVRATRCAVAAALQIDRVSPVRVWYPTEEEIPSGELTKDHLAVGFTFWKDSQGVLYKEEKAPLTPLPEVTRAKQSITLKPRVPRSAR
ncbi:TIGR03986 family type III CRISPR-associated RAMP protein [Rhizohabitans arisaemae]|uniref:TIGR03986 family type III CRISPR-associated RAMP protein n=1 Tax=Rhizohabitans arisaemae TaxID=2720610 RepID=UPI0024B0CE07|nr:TIGR03986 family CRISPR-associated RAMP protein [Rhizohabitans arisaemae]